MRAIVLILALVAATGLAGPARAAATATVRVNGNAFDPVQARVDPGGSVTWVVQEGGHTIVADDGRFRFRGPGGSTLAAGATVTFATSSVDELVRYHCEIHGGPGLLGMAGVIRVGNPPPPPPSTQPVIRVPEGQPTLAEAVAVAAPGHRIELASGTHAITTTVEVGISDVTIVGRGDTVLAAAPGTTGLPDAALRLTGSRVRVEALQIHGFRTSGIHVDGAQAAAIVDVRVHGRGLTIDGISASDVNGLTLRRIETNGMRGTGVHIVSCPACGAVLDGVRAEGNGVGVLVEAARGVIVRDSTITGNASGIVARVNRQAALTQPVVVSVLDNVITDNADVGVWLAGPSDSLVSGNVITANGDGIVIAGDWATDTDVTANDSTGNADADLAWDGLGRRVRFRDNAGTNPTLPDPTVLPRLLLRTAT